MAGWWVELHSAAQGGTLTLTGHPVIVDVSSDQVVRPSAGLMLLTGHHPMEALEARPNAGTFTLVGHTPDVTVSASQNIQPLAGALALTGSQPTVAVTANQVAQPTAGTLTLTGAQPTVTATQNRLVQPTGGALSLTGHQPTVTIASLRTKPTVVGADITDSSSVTIPAHQIGDIIVLCIWRRSATTVSKPTATGTVPAWVDIDAPAGTASRYMRTAYFVATATNTTTGLWTGAVSVGAIVLRGQGVTPIGGHAISVGVSEIGATAPAVTLTNPDNTSQLLHFHAGGSAAAWNTQPAGYTRQDSTTSMAINTKDTTTTDGAVTNTNSAAASASGGATIEIIGA